MTELCGCVTDPADDIAEGVVLVVAQCALCRVRCLDLDARLVQGLDWELDQMVSAHGSGKRCERIWKDGSP